MLTLHLLEQLDKLSQLKQQPEQQNQALEQARALIRTIRQYYYQRGVHYLYSLFAAWGMSTWLPPGVAMPLLEPEPHPLADNYPNFYNHPLYQQLIPLCQLAGLIEQQGNPQEHAFKLATLFTDYDAAFAYLLTFKQQNSYQYLVYQACQVMLPNQADCDFNAWRHLAQKHLLDPHFRNLLPHAPNLEALSKTGLCVIKQKKPNRTLISQTKKELATVSKQYKNWKKQPQQYKTLAEKQQRQQQLAQLSQQKLDYRLLLSRQCQGLPVREADMQVLRAWYVAYQQQTPYQRLARYGINENEIARFFMLERVNDDNAIPNLIIDGQLLNYPGYYLKKLDIMDDEEAAIAACLGNITQCCQYLGGAGSKYVIHGLTSPNGGFYVVCQGDAQQPQITDPIVAQTWAWASDQGICFDTIELVWSNSGQWERIANFFRLLAHVLCQTHGIAHVNTGSNAMSATRENIMEMRLGDFNDYVESYNRQGLLAARHMPYLFYQKTNNPAFQSLIEQDTNILFQQTIATAISLRHQPIIQNMLTYGLANQKQTGLLLFLQTMMPVTHQAEWDELLAANRLYVQQLEQGNICFAALAQGAYIHLQTHHYSIHKALLLAVSTGNLAMVKQLLELNDEGSLQRYLNNQLLTSYPLTDPQRYTIVNLLIDAGAHVNATDGLIPLIHAVKTNDLAMVTLLINKKAPVDTVDEHHKTALYWAAELGHTAILDYLLHQKANVNVVSCVKNQQYTPLMAAMKDNHSDIIARLLACEGIQFDYKNSNHVNALHLAAAHDVTAIDNILTLYPNEQKFNALATKTLDGDTVLHFAYKNPDMIKFILAFYPPDQRLNAVVLHNKKYKNVANLANQYPDAFNTILTMILPTLPSTQRINQLKFVPPPEGLITLSFSILQLAVMRSEYLIILLEHFTEAEWLQLFNVEIIKMGIDPLDCINPLLASPLPVFQHAFGVHFLKIFSMLKQHERLRNQFFSNSSCHLISDIKKATSFDDIKAAILLRTQQNPDELWLKSLLQEVVDEGIDVHELVPSSKEHCH